MGRPLTHEYVVKMLDYDSVVGSFLWRVDIPHKIKAGQPAGCVVNGKLMIGLNGQPRFGHRLAWLYVHGHLPEGYIVPINGDFLDCRIANLKNEAVAQRAERSVIRSTSKSGVTGVSWNSRDNKWVASVTFDYRQLHLGSFDTIEAAKDAYDAAKCNVPMRNPINLQEKRTAIALAARQRRAWKRAVDENGNCAWPSFAAFVRDIGTPPKDGSILVPIDASKPVGPGNFTWFRRSKYDNTTAEGRKDYRRDHRRSKFDKYRADGLRKSFGMEMYEYQELFERQDGKCAICANLETVTRDGVVINLAVDHCHTTGAVRGLLCRGCNHGIGNFRDDAERIRKAAAYIEHYAELEAEK